MNEKGEFRGHARPGHHALPPFSHAAAAADYKVTCLLPPEGDDYLYPIKERR